MLDYGFSTTEWSRNRGNTTFCNWEESINNSLSCYKRHFRRKFFQIWTSTTNRPFLHHCKFFFSVFGFDYSNHFFYCKFTGFNFFYFTFDSVRNHDFMIYYNCFLNSTENISGFYFFTCFYNWFKVPFDISFQRRKFNTSF